MILAVTLALLASGRKIPQPLVVLGAALVGLSDLSLRGALTREAEMSRFSDQLANRLAVGQDLARAGR